MSILKIERTFPVAPEKVFAFVTQTDHLLKWWGPEGVSMKEHNLDLSRPGAWSSTLVNSQGALHKMSGEVVAVDPPKSVEFTWGWHDARINAATKPGCCLKSVRKATAAPCLC
ncbi:SRPBCC family protein [Anderseniella sp. Alg231-50]|uniref:SRPBCC family protein n=1 Tax=Anderseniella sp. Alg231-50 TaxID=1922226 RepID=UPI00307C7013